jgi:hypothetical protein
MSDVASVQHGMAIKTDGSLWAWGYNIGDGTLTWKLRPYKLMDGVAQVANYGYTVVKTDGSVWDKKRSDGRNDGSIDYPVAYYKREGIDNVAFASDNYDYIIKKDGSLWSSVSYYDSGLGAVVRSDTGRYNKIMDGVASFSNTTSDSYRMAVKTDGSL